jgi:hypothetical protein
MAIHSARAERRASERRERKKETRTACFACPATAGAYDASRLQCAAPRDTRRHPAVKRTGPCLPASLSIGAISPLCAASRTVVSLGNGRRLWRQLPVPPCAGVRTSLISHRSQFFFCTMVYVHPDRVPSYLSTATRCMPIALFILPIKNRIFNHGQLYI